jgi:hypothetical protein
MALQPYAVIDPSGNVLNVVLWDNVSTYNVAPNILVSALNQPNAQTGGTYSGGVFTAPAPATPAPGIFIIDSPTSGSTFNVPSPVGQGYRKLYLWLSPSAALATLTLVFPSAPQDGDDYYLKSQFAITALTLTLPTGTRLFNFSSPAAIAAQTGYHITYSAQQSAWFLF